MEQSKPKLCKILLLYHLIQDEKMSIRDHLDCILSEAHHLELNHKHLTQKDFSEIYKYVIKVLNQLCEVNSLLETLKEDSPVGILMDKEKGNITKPEIKKEHLETLSEASSSRFLLSFGSFDSSTKIESTSIPRVKDITSNSINPEIPTTSELENVDLDIQNLKKSLFEFSEKHGLNKQNFSEMKDYYGKPSTSYQAVMSESILSTQEQKNHEYCKKHFEPPEKDTNTLQEFNEKKSLDTLINQSSFQESEVFINGNLNEDLGSCSPLYTDNSCTSTDVEIPSLKNDEEEHQEINFNKHTALRKLNNFKVKETESNKGCSMPDLKLQPSGIIIQNNKSVTEKTVTNKVYKKKGKEYETLYELKYKDTPREGQECLISHIESPFEFYIHVIDDASLLIDDIPENIKKCSNSKIKYDSKKETLNIVGRFCFAFIEKYNNWYRVEILDGYLNENHDEVLTHLVDYGNKILTSFRNLQKMTRELSEIPILATRCHLPLLYPPSSTHLNRLTEWPSCSIEAMLNISELENESQFFQIVYANQETNNSVAIDLYHPKLGDKENTLGQILIDTKLAIQLVDDYDADNMEFDVFMEELEADNINEAITGYDPRDEARICRFTKKNGTCYKGKNCKLEHVPLPKDGFTTDKEEMFTEAMYSLLLPAIGSKVLLLITGYIDACRFFAQIVITPYNYKGKYIMDREMYLLLQEINSVKMIKTYEKFKISPAIGEIVLVHHWKRWCRAVVREIIMGESGDPIEVQLFVLDIGEYVNACIKDVRKIKPDFLKLPFQAVECYIYNYQMKKDCSLKEVKDFFYKNLYFHNFVASTIMVLVLFVLVLIIYFLLVVG